MESFRKLISNLFPESSKADRGGEMIVRAVITRADGTVEDLGVIDRGFIKDWETVRNNISGGN